MPEGRGASGPAPDPSSLPTNNPSTGLAGPSGAKGDLSPASSTVSLVDLEGTDRERAVPALKDGFVGIYRWHAKRTLRSARWVRAALIGEEVASVSVLEQLDPEVGYVYYLATASKFRRQGLATLLLDDALEIFRREGARVVYAAAEEDNDASIALFRARAFRTVERKELGFREGGLGAWGLRSRMTLVGGEVLLGLRLAPPASPTSER